MKGSRQQNAGSADEATQGGEAQRDFARVEALVWTERMLSALGNGVKGGKWFSLMDKVFAPKTLAAAWTKVRANKGAAGVDGQSIERFAAKAEDYLAELSAALRAGSYRPQAVKRVDIPKGDGRTRPLGIPTVKDRIVQQAVRLVIEPIFETRFRDGSYGFRPGRGCHDALREVDRLIKDGYAHVVDADLASYFDSIPHDRLVARVEEKVSDGRVLDLIRGWLKADILKGLERWTPARGSPQGAVISPLLANIYLDPLDAAMAERGRRMVRYADDFVILCRTREEADAALAEVRAWVSENGLALHPEKTHGAFRRDLRGSRTNAKVTPLQAVLRYSDLLHVEDLFRRTEAILRTRPIFHSSDAAIRGHVFCSFLALSMQKHLDDLARETGLAPEWRTSCAISTASPKCAFAIAAPTGCSAPTPPLRLQASFVAPMSPCRRALARPVPRRPPNPNPHKNAAVAPGVAPRRPEFRRNALCNRSFAKIRCSSRA